MLTEAQILALADNELAKAEAQAYSKPIRWYLAARDGNIIWGLYVKQGKVSAAVDVRNNRTFCTCKKERCRHVLGLWLMAAWHERVLIPREAPDTVKRALQMTGQVDFSWLYCHCSIYPS